MISWESYRKHAACNKTSREIYDSLVAKRGHCALVFKSATCHEFRIVSSCLTITQIRYTETSLRTDEKHLPDAVRVRRYGRFGKNVIQLLQTLYISKVLGIPRACLEPGFLSIPNNTLTSDGVLIILSGRSTDRRVYAYSFYVRLISTAYRPEDTYVIAATFRDVILRNLQRPSPCPSALFPHIRSGDLFPTNGALTQSLGSRRADIVLGPLILIIQQVSLSSRRRQETAAWKFYWITQVPLGVRVTSARTSPSYYTPGKCFSHVELLGSRSFFSHRSARLYSIQWVFQIQVLGMTLTAFGGKHTKNACSTDGRICHGKCKWW
jgi:hypothetical protein